MNAGPVLLTLIKMFWNKHEIHVVENILDSRQNTVDFMMAGFNFFVIFVLYEIKLFNLVSSYAFSEIYSYHFNIQVRLLVACQVYASTLSSSNMCRQVAAIRVDHLDAIFECNRNCVTKKEEFELNCKL